MSQSVIHFGIIAITLLSAVSSAAAEDIPLTTESSDQRVLPASGSVRYTLKTNPGDFVRGFVDEISVNVVVHLMEPDGSTLRRFWLALIFGRHLAALQHLQYQVPTL